MDAIHYRFTRASLSVAHRAQESRTLFYTQTKSHFPNTNHTTQKKIVLVFKKKKMTWTVYILKCADGKYYTGCTSNLEKRLKYHLEKQVKFTATRLPFELVTYIVFNDKYKAYFFEKYLKSGSGKAFAMKRFF